jgi:primosomal protein N''
MSKKLWFIFENDHHIGPFETEQMIEKISRGELLEHHPIWSEGLATWTKAQEIEPFDFYFFPPDLPPPPSLEQVEIEQDELPPELPPLPPIDEEVDELPPPLPPLPVVEDEEELAAEATLKDFKLIERGEKQRSKKLWPFGVALLVVALFFQTWLYYGSRRDIPVFHELRAIDAENFRLFLNGEHLQDESFRLALTRDARALIMASKLKGSWQVFIRLESVPNRVLSERKVILESRALLDHHRALFRDIEVIEGLGFSAGEYKVEIIAHHPFDKDQIVRQESVQAFLRSSLEEFEEELLKMRQVLRDKELGHLRERYETYQTLGMLIERIFTLYQETLSQIRDPNLIDRFEARYAQEVGPLLQGLILESHSKMNQLEEQGEVDEAKSYELLVEFGKSIGAMVSDMVTTTKRARQFNRAGRDRLERLFESRQKTLLSELNVRVGQLAKALEKAP